MNERYTLVRDDGRLALRDAHAPSGVSVCLDVADVQRRIRQGRRLAVAKACGVRRRGLSVLDGMAGFGLDGITLAALGCRVLMVERDPLLYALLEDAVARAGAELQLGSIECRRADVREILAAPAAFDTIYLDPMFPERSGSALPRMSAQLLSDYVGPPDDDLAGLIAQSCGSARQRVVVKRRRLDPTVASPDWQIIGRSVRFDVYRGSASSVDSV